MVSSRTSAGILADRAAADTPRLPVVTAAPAPDPGLVASLRGLDRDGRLLFAMRTLRMFGYGFLAVVLVLYLAAARARSAGHRDGAHPDAHRRHDHLALADDQRGPARPAPRADRGRRADGRRRRRLRVHDLAPAADPGRGHRRRLTDRQRGRAVPRRRAGGADADRPRYAPDARPSPGTTSSGTSRPRPARSEPGC